MSAVKALYTLTKQMHDMFERANDYKREELIEQFNDFVAKRGQLIEKLGGELTDEEKRLAQETIKLDETLRKKAEQYMNGFQKDIASFKKQQAGNKKYINPYQSLRGKDGGFIDKRN
ncbi:flagellar protein FliT [Alkalibacillus flavidus]|uniref:Flagellar protein FliT n=1 Tax=Alkalibacillus flavidus TaxID=546021 RepID=A0ABV2KTR2_9BACI